jgi:hypothetical protein
VLIPTRDDARVVIPARGLVALLVFGVGCAHESDAAGPHGSRELTLAYDDNHATATLTFPSLTYESVLRFELPSGKHQSLALRLMAASAGTIVITFYENAILECPGDEIHVITRDLVKEDVSNGKDGRWVVEDLRGLPPLKEVIWIGVRKVGGAPSLWTSTVVSGQTYLRERDPSRAMGLLPVKRTPMIRLDVRP